MKHIDPASATIFWGTLILLFGIIGRYLAKRLRQPAVLGELLMGILVGNICYWWGVPLMIILRDSASISVVIQQVLNGIPLKEAIDQIILDPHYAQAILKVMSGLEGQQWIAVTYVVDAFSRYGVIFLLFMVGLESSLDDLRKTGKAALKVAVIGIVAPIILGIILTELLLPKTGFYTALFIAATLCATSVGITARVLKEMRKLKTREAQTILGAAMIDDVLGLIILAVVSGIVISDAVNFFMISKVVVMAMLFFPVALWFGPRLLRYVIRWMSFVSPWEAKLLTSFVFIMGFSWLATLVEMSTIVGAFVAGLILHEGFFESREREQTNPMSIKNLVAPFEAVFAPVFFMLIGIQVRLETFFDKQTLLFSICLLFVAIIGKLCSGFGGNKRDDRLLIGIGMIPRGEVGLVFASVGKNMHIIPDALFSAMILMVAISTFVTPIWMKYHYAKRKHRKSLA